MFRKTDRDEKRGGHDVSLGCKSIRQWDVVTLLEGDTPQNRN